MLELKDKVGIVGEIKLTNLNKNVIIDIMDYLYKYANQNKLPIMNQTVFEHYTKTIGKEQFRLDLSEYIAKERPVFPLKSIT